MSSRGQGKTMKEKEFKYILLEIYLHAYLDLRIDQKTCTGLLQLGSFICFLVHIVSSSTNAFAILNLFTV